jgi:hypothetical protein
MAVANRAMENVHTVRRPMNEHGALALECPSSGACYHVVEYANSRIRELLADVDPGSRVRVELERAGARANVWRATRVHPGVE